LSVQTSWQAPVFIELEEPPSTKRESPPPVEFAPPVMMVEPPPVKAEIVAPVAALPQEAPTKPPLLPAWPNIPKLPHSNTWWLPALVFALLTFLVSAAVVDMFRYVGEQYQTSFFLGSFFLLLVLIITAALIRLGWNAALEIRQLRMVDVLQQQGAKLCDSRQHGEALPYLYQVAALYQGREELAPRLDRFFITADDAHHDQALCQLFSTQVLAQVDHQARTVVSRHANQTALLVMISPFPFISMVVTLWRTLAMIRDVAALYGGRPGWLGTLSLLSLTVQNLLYADVSETMVDSFTDTFGGSTLSFLSTHLAQGVGSAMMTARVGIKAMEQCRPLPFQASEKPGLNAIRSEIIASLKHLAGKKSAKTTS